MTSSAHVDAITKLSEQIHTHLQSYVSADTPLAIVDFPDIKNCGDSAIWLGEIAYLKKRFGVEPAYVCRSHDLKEDLLRAHVPEGPIFIHGGGNFGDIWAGKQAFKEKILTVFKDRQVVQFPQSIHYNSTERADETARIIEAHGNFKLFVRDRESLEFAQAKFQCDVQLCPDMAFCIGPLKDRPTRLPVLAMLREDLEKADFGAWTHTEIPREDWITEQKWKVQLAKLKGATEAGGPLASEARRRFKILDAAANQRFERGISQISRARAVLTDRLHVHICSTLLGRPHAVLDNNYGKIARHMGAFYPDLPETGLIHRASSLDDAVAWAKSKAQ